MGEPKEVIEGPAVSSKPGYEPRPERAQEIVTAVGAALDFLNLRVLDGVDEQELGDVDMDSQWRGFCRMYGLPWTVRNQDHLPEGLVRFAGEDSAKGIKELMISAHEVQRAIETQRANTVKKVARAVPLIGGALSRAVDGLMKLTTRGEDEYSYREGQITEKFDDICRVLGITPAPDKFSNPDPTPAPNPDSGPGLAA